MKNRVLLGLAGACCLSPVTQAEEPAHNRKTTSEEVVVWGEKKDQRDAGYTNPTSLLTQEDFASINIATTEDLVKYEPSIVIRRRYIGDSNGTLGMRGSNMFQTSRSMVFADGVPLHYLLQSRWSGAPRWSMVSPSEIAQVEVIYGPFSAEYSGNAMGGVVNMETAIPQEREVHFDTSYFSQNFDAYGFDGSLSGYKTFVSYGDKIGSASVYFSYNRLDNEAQPQSFYFDGNGASALNSASGSVIGNDSNGNSRHYYADSGIENAITNNYKMKVGYEFGGWFALLNAAYEDRATLRDSATPYIYDADGNPIYSGSVALADGSSFRVNGSRLGVSELDRDSLNLGLRLRGDLSANTQLEANISDFALLRDKTRASALNPDDPDYTPSGLVTDYDGTGWQTADVKLSFADTATGLGIDNLELVTGLRHEHYQLGINVFNSSDWRAGEKSSLNNRSGGETAISAGFVQMNWDITPVWDLSLGGRYEHWQSQKGYYSQGSGDAMELVDVPNRSDSQFSPKFSLGFKPLENWALRYSFARAYRFPIVEELFSQYQAFNSASEANPGLAPENGLHHSFMLDYSLESGFLRLNLFHETIRDAIESFTDVATSITTFHSMGEVQTTGVEFVANQYDWLIGGLDLRFNLAYLDSEIVSNPKNPGLEGNKAPRLPDWRGNFMLSYHVTDVWDISTNLQYASKSFGRLENTDTEHNVYGAQDGYTRLGLKTTYDLSQNTELGFGIDNLTDEITYVAHPWPGRTIYGEVSVDF